MKLLQKILMIVVMGAVGENVDVYGMNPPAAPVAANLAGANVLDFDTIFNGGVNIPGMFQPKIHRPGGAIAFGNAGNTLAYVYFTIIPNGEVPLPAAFAAAVQTPVNVADYNIYFPADGSQPTTAAAVNYALANVDNRENSPITEWYMKMFGVIPINHAAIAAAGGPGHVPLPIFVQAGWNNANPAAIITFDNAVCVHGPNGHNICTTIDNDVNHDVPDPISGIATHRIDLILNEFRKIASTSVGRVLLYRMLIEIRRTQAGVGCTENPIFAQGALNRNSRRSITISYGNPLGQSPFAFFINKVVINFSSIWIPISVLGKTHIGGYTEIIETECPLDVSLFHEMIHWYHWLRNTNRFSNERDPAEVNANLENTEIGQYYWSRLNRLCVNQWDGQVNSGNAWRRVDNIDFEEMRTILGAPYGGSMNDYINGDDLSENLYRMCRGIPLRFGYDPPEHYYEDRKVINRVVDACSESYVHYTRGYVSNFQFNYSNGRAGLGKCRIH
ncbi:MAG: hypothetical protein LBG04_03395 [Holosporaceae bacterium]|jgi:hypothetical protein|nr:hypothetical protein [Holosporaceae bacterium]